MIDPTRPSHLPRRMLCGASDRAPEISIGGPAGEITAMGSAVHALLADIVKNDWKAPPEDLGPYLHAYGLTNAKELRWLAWQGMKMVDQLCSAGLQIAGIETPLKIEADSIVPITISGTADLAGMLPLPDSIPGDRQPMPAVVDYKSGYLDSDYDDQLMFYLFAHWLPVWDQYEHGLTVVLWLREGQMDVQPVNKVAMLAWWARLGKAIGDTAERPGAHCAGCARHHECAAYAAFLKGAAADILAFDPSGPAPEGLDHVDYGTLWPIRSMLTSTNGILNAYETAVRLILENETESLPTGAGKKLIIKKEERTEVDVAKGWEALSVSLGCRPESIEMIQRHGDLLKLGLTDYKARVVDGKAGKKKDIIENELALLEKAGALRKKEITKLAQVKVI